MRLIRDNVVVLEAFDAEALKDEIGKYNPAGECGMALKLRRQRPAT
jgi:hypothetical protein